MEYNDEHAYYMARLIRICEEKIVELYPSDKIKSPVHLSIGQEGVAVGVAQACESRDFIFSNYRSHAHYLAHGGNLHRFWAELYGVVGGCADGRGGSMHLGDLSVNFAYTSAIVATQIPNAVGYGFGLKQQNRTKMPSGRVICYLGDGATEEGVFWESLNFAALHNIPVLFICENNKYAIYSHQKTRQANDNIIGRVESFGVNAHYCLDNSTRGIYNYTRQLLQKIDETSTPQFLEIPTSRLRDHVGVGDDRVMKFRPDEELQQAIDNDELKKLAEKLPQKLRQQCDERALQAMTDAIAFAESQPFPSINGVIQNVWA